MKTLLRTLMIVASILLITVCAILIAEKGLGRTSIDLTQERLYTLSDGTRNILAGLNQPVKLKLYYSRTAALKGPEGIRYFNNYYLYVKDLLDEYVSLANGKLTLEVLDPRKFSQEEQDALAEGVKSIPLSEDENFFFGLVAQTELGKKDVIPIFEPRREEFVEYDVSKLISALVQQARRKIGVISSLPVVGMDLSPYMRQMMKAQGRAIEEPWTLIKHLRQQYEVTSVSAETEAIDESIDFLLVIHPKDLAEKTLYAIDQYVMKGGKLIVFQDIYCIADEPQDTSNPYAAMGYSRESSLNALLRTWGVEQLPDVIATDRALALKVGDPPAPLMAFLGLNESCMNRSEVVTSDLHSIHILFAGVLKPAEAQGTTVEPLLQTTSTGGTWKPANAFELMMPRAETIRRAMVEGTEPIMLGCRISGTFRTNFPDGPPKSEEPEEATPEETDEAANTPDESKPGTITQSSDEAMVLVFSDVDMITDQLAYRTTFFGTSQVEDNASLVFNAIDYLSGSSDLIAIRSRGRFQRPFHVVDKIEANLEETSAKEMDKLNEQIDAAQERLNAMGAKDMQLVESALLKEQRQINEQIREFENQLNAHKAHKRDKIEDLKVSLQTHNMFWAPLCVLLVAILLWLIRSIRTGTFRRSGHTPITNRNLLALPVMAIVLAIVTVVLYAPKPSSSIEFIPGSLLLQGLEIDNVGSIVITKDDQVATLERDGNGFTLAERNGYPASIETVNRLIMDCMKIRCRDIVTHSPKNHVGLGVAEGGEGTESVKFLDNEGNLLVGILKGGMISDRGGFYVRLTGDDTVYASEGYLRIPIGPKAFLNTTPLSVAKAEIERVDITTEDGSYTISRDENDKIALVNIPEGKQVKENSDEDVFTALVNFRFNDVVPADEITADWKNTYTCRLKSGLTYIVRTAEVDGKTYARLSAKGSGVKSVEISKTESEEELKKKEAILLAVEEAERFTPEHAAWVYELPDWIAGKLCKPMAELIEDIPSAEAPEEIAASHILIAYAGAERSTATRSKEEAKVLADKLLVQAKAPDADFAALARENSDGPSKDNGGDLSTFKKGVMAPAFEEAAFALKVGGISEVVETPFGFHIIKRTK